MTDNKNVDYAPGMRVIIRDEEWVIRKVVTNTLNNRVLYCSGISALVKDRNATFLEDLESIEIVKGTEVGYNAEEIAENFMQGKWTVYGRMGTCGTICRGDCLYVPRLQYTFAGD